MSNKKTELRFFTIAQWEQEQEYLRSMHNNGWKFVRVNALGCYHFERCEPEDVVYGLDYNPEGLAHMSEYVQMFRDCGWEYLQTYVGYSYFRKPAADMVTREEIFSDNESKHAMLERVFRGRCLPLIVIFFCIILPQLFLQFSMHSLEGNIFTGIYIGLAVIYLCLFAWYGIMLVRYRNSNK